MRLEPTFITPLALSFVMDGEEVTVTAGTNSQLGAMLQLLQPVLPELMNLPEDLVQRLNSKEGVTHRDVLVLLELLSDHVMLPQQLVATGMAWPMDKVQRLLPDRFAYVFACLVQVNADFFERATPLLASAADMFGALMPAAAPSSSTPGPDSSPS